MYGAVDTWTDAEIISLAGIVSGLSDTDVAKLNIQSHDALNAIGTTGYWVETKVSSISLVSSSLPVGIYCIILVCVKDKIMYSNFVCV